LIGLDSNVVVRYLAQDDGRQSALATRLLERELSPDAPGFISLVTLAEIVWVITSVYSADRALIERAVEGLLSAQQLRVQDAESVWLALQDWRDSDADFSDALIARVALAAGCTHTCTFDRAAAKNSGFELLN
jgi:predicted nucleic-acid-binding protein